MISGFIVKKKGMSGVYLPSGEKIAVTKCSFSPLAVTQVKTADKDGYQAIQVAFGARKNLSKPVSSKLKKLKINQSPKGFKEFKLTSDQIPAIGQEIAIDSVFAAGDSITVTGTTKGHGYAGVIKRYGFHRQPVSGGQSDRVRAPGSIGAQTPGKVVKGKKMPGHFGNITKTIKGLKIVAVDKENNEISINGSLPGAINSWLIIKKVIK